MTQLPPALPLYPYQVRWVTDQSRFKIINKAQQIGMSFGGVSLEPVLDGLDDPRATWVLLSAGERQSKELINQVRMHAQAVGAAADYFEDEFRGDEGSYKLLEVKLPTGARVLGLPANPDTARGFSGHVCLDEFAFHKDSRAIWKALFPIVSRGFKLRIVSTPNGKNNMFYQLFTDESGRWSKHFVDIYKAVDEGYPADIDELREAINDPDAWAQEYECQFLDAATALLTFELIAGCSDPNVMASEPVLSALSSLRNLSLGMDVARSGHLTVLWLLERVGDVYWTRAVQELQNTRFRVQRDVLNGLLELPGLYGACIDSTGIGNQMAEEATEDFGAKVEGVNFNPVTKKDMATRILRTFQDRRIRIPEGNILRNDLHSVSRVITSKGNISYAAPETKDGHADRFWSVALALRAAAAEAGPVRVACPSTMEGKASSSTMKPRRRFWTGIGRARRALEGYEEVA